ncbi:Phox-like protein [Canariomyces notabilis]|uniref:Phox-like protein n=1 Tax=Canariomyces notabilis TaxID=2074819 RepID=A0AAN6YUE3_9PEZI|nr:Phox-like protein [Canariomyces arenarius]
MAPPLEISIPTTSVYTPPADDDTHKSRKPYTLYNLTIRLPLRSFVVQKRYSDFASLHSELTRQAGGVPPPCPLPAKSWFRSTVSSPEFTEDRRAGLERYLRAIAEPPDRRWRDTPAWRAFLNLPPAGSVSVSGLSVDGRAVGLREQNMAAGAADPGTWLDMHRELKAALHDARVALGRRDNALENGTRVEAGAQAKRALIKAGSLLAALGDGLALRRRRDLIAAARVERDGLDKLSSSMAVGGGAAGGSEGGVATASDRAALLGGGGGGGKQSMSRPAGRVLGGAPLPETERTRELDNEGMVQLQRDVMQEQDAEVEALARIVRRQKEMGLAINDEVNRQIDMLDKLNEDVDVVGRKLGVAKDRVKRL